MHFSDIDFPARLAFSGGRTSGYLLWKILEAFGGALPPDLLITFYNTGREMEQTLEFVQECAERWGVRIRWLEYRRDETKPIVVKKRGQDAIGQHAFTEVDFRTASRDGEPFEQLIECKAAFRRARGLPEILPNAVQRFCTAELKQRTGDRFMESLGIAAYTTIVGLRADEPARVGQLLGCATKRRDFRCPLYDAGLTETDVLSYWRGAGFDLHLPHTPDMGTYAGNCDFCFLKRRDKIKRMAIEYPGRVGWWAKQEAKTGATFRRDRFTYTDLAAGRVPLEVVPQDRDGPDLTCFCTD